MANVTIDSTISSSTGRAPRTVVFTTADIGYSFFIDSDGTARYRKTLDGGASWGEAVGFSSGATTNIAFDVWYDQWTPGDTTGTLIHLVLFDGTLDDVFYRYLDTNGDSLGSQKTVFAGSTAVAGVGVHVTVTKTLSGYIYVAYDIDTGSERGVHRSTDGGLTFSASLATFIEASPDWAVAIPASGTGDGNDCAFLYHDASTNELTIKVWDSSLAAAVESAVIVSLVEANTDLTAQYPFSASIRHSDGHIIITAVTERDTVAADHRMFDVALGSGGVGGTPSFSSTELTAITTDIDDHYYPQMFIDQSTDDLYVAYTGKRDGSETLFTSAGVYYTKSTDGGSTWTSGDTNLSDSGVANLTTNWVPLMGDRFISVWRNTSFTLETNTENSVTFGGGGSVSGLFHFRTQLFSSKTFEVVTLQGGGVGGGGTVHSISRTDTAAATADENYLATLGLSRTETGSIVSSELLALITPISRTETGEITGEEHVLFTSNISRTETGAIADSISVTFVTAISKTESVAATSFESWGEGQSFAISRAESTLINATQTLLAELGLNVSESLVASATQSLVADFAQSLNEQAAATADQSVLAQLGLSSTEQAGAVDERHLQVVVNVAVTDVALAEASGVVGLLREISVQETAAGADEVHWVTGRINLRVRDSVAVNFNRQSDLERQSQTRSVSEDQSSTINRVAESKAVTSASSNAEKEEKETTLRRDDESDAEG